MPVFSKIMYDEKGTAYQYRDGKRINIEITYPPGQKIRRRREGTFAMVPLQWAAKMTAATETPKAMVGVWLLYRAWQKKSLTFDVPNEALAAFGISRNTKSRALRQFEAAGLIKVERRPRKSPLVTLLRL